MAAYEEELDPSAYQISTQFSFPHIFLLPPPPSFQGRQAYPIQYFPCKLSFSPSKEIMAEWIRHGLTCK